MYFLCQPKRFKSDPVLSRRWVTIINVVKRDFSFLSCIIYATTSTGTHNNMLGLQRKYVFCGLWDLEKKSSYNYNKCTISNVKIAVLSWGVKYLLMWIREWDPWNKRMGFDPLLKTKILMWGAYFDLSSKSFIWIYYTVNLQNHAFALKLYLVKGSILHLNFI